MNSYETFAFISYSRSDAAYAEKIQHFLEHYKYPQEFVLPQNRPKDDKYIRKVFLDTSDLSTRKPNFYDELESELKQARYMLVICSSHSARAKSVCHWEIETFLKYHSLDNILPIALNGIGEGNIPEELRPIIERRNIVLLNPELPMESLENRSKLFHVAEFLLKVDAVLLNNRYEKDRREIKRRRIILSMIALVVTCVLSSGWAYESHLLKERAEEHTKFEQKVFPASIVWGYAHNFLAPLINEITQNSDQTSEKCIVIIALPQDYGELPNRAEQKRKVFLADAAEFGWKYEETSVPVQNRRAIKIDEMFPQSPLERTHVYADMASTVAAIKHVVDYLTDKGNSNFHASSMEEKEKLTRHYIEEFKSTLLSVLMEKEYLGPPESGNYQIYFVANRNELKTVLEEIGQSAQP